MKLYLGSHDILKVKIVCSLQQKQYIHHRYIRTCALSD